MRVLSLFDGISCARVALARAGLPVETYMAAEIDPNAIKVSERNHPDIVRLGDVRSVDCSSLGRIDLLIGGSPCQDLSIAKKDRQGLDGNRSGLFWEYVRIWRETKPMYFVLENVASMPKKDRDMITETLGVEPVLFDAALVSAQSRKRLFWTNIKFDLPADRGIVLKDILQPDAEVDPSMVINGKSFCLTATYHKVGEGQKEYEHNKEKKQRTMVRVGHIGNNDGQTNRVYSPEGKAPTQLKGPNGGALPTLISPTQDKIRKLTPVECERLQGLPDTYTEGVAKTHRYKCLGNAFHVDVIAHILSHCRNHSHTPALPTI